MPKDARELANVCAALLLAEWEALQRDAQQGILADVVDDATVRDAIRGAINSKMISYRYVLPAQLVAKLADPTLDCRSLQVAAGSVGAFDARTICHRVIVPFDRQNNSVLGGSPEPYVNNPLRVPAISMLYVGQQKNKGGWQELCSVLDTVEARAEQTYTHSIFKQVLIEIYRRLASVSVTYPVPLRISMEGCLALVSSFLSQASGGDRAQAVASALFRTIGEDFHLFTEVRRGRINAADAASGQVADIECIDESGDTVLAVEVKDQALTVRHVQDKVPSMRAQRVKELIFLALRGIAPDDVIDIEAVQRREYASGQNIYVFADLAAFVKPVFTLLGETGRRRFLEAVGQELDEYGSHITHRRAWASLLAQA